ncbi:MAG TPA: LptF/LptG family permease [Dictyoglomaceae bacterium]|nr:LptF/LptG family permease [Dictyoglomaceae bacterium]HOL39276.1 LptF/LptG family permease [Dictyoglomaceae bacterium]HPP15865.1 LptF/LptG family permease [Dictyoglomaceae bacterium]
MIKLYHKYIFSEILGPFFLGILGFILVMLIQILYEFSDFIITRRVSFEVVLKLLYYKIPSLLVFVIPVSLLFAIIFSFGRLIKDGELFAMRSSGIYFLSLTLTPFLLALLLSGFLWFFNYSLIPESNYRANRLIQKYFFFNPAPVKGENIFFHDEEGRYFYVKKVIEDKNIMENVLVYDTSSNSKQPIIYSAEEASWNRDSLTLKRGVVHYLGEDLFTSWEGKFEEFTINLPQDFMFIFYRDRTPQEMSTSEIQKRITVYKKSGISARSYEVERNLRVAQSVAVPIFALLGFSVILLTGKGGRLWGTAFSVIIAFFYYGFNILARSLGEYAVFSPFLSAWLPNLTLGTLSLGVFLWKIRKW